jgi:hypothetical protein
MQSKSHFINNFQKQISMIKKLFSMLLACTLFTTAFAQPVIKVQKDLGGNDFDFFTSMALTKDGGVIAGGYSTSNISGNKTENSRGTDDFWVIKLNASNKIEWDKTIGGSDFDILTSLQQTSDGGYILGGYSFSNTSGEKTQNSKGSADYWIVKLDSSGNIQFDKTIGGNSFDNLFALQQTTDGGYILGGTSFSNHSGDKTENSRGGTDFWVVKLNSSGNIEWDKTIGGSDEDDLSSLQQTTDGGYILGGLSFSNISGEKTESNKGVADFWIVKLDGNGNIQFDKTIGGSSNDNLSALQQTSDGGYILGGHSFSNISGDKTENSRGSEGFADYWVVKLTSTGNIQFDKTIGGSDLDILTSLQQTTDGGYILGGRSFSNTSFEKTEDTKGTFDDDYWIVKLGKKGNEQWDKTIGGTEFDECYSIKETSKNRYVVGGWSFSNTSGDKTSDSKGERDYWLVNVFFKTGNKASGVSTENIGDPAINNDDSRLSGVGSTTNLDQNAPNPFSQNTVIHYHLPDNVSNAQLVVNDATGLLVKSFALNASDNGQVTVTGGELHPGAYSYSLIINGQKTETKQMILTK